MADQSDVENALVAAITATLYPGGPAAPSLISCAGLPVMVRVYRGWPVTAALHADLSNGIVNVTVFPSGEPRNTTRYPTNWTVTTAIRPSLTVSVAANAVTFGGITAVGQMAGLSIDGATYIYLVQIGDTTAFVAAALAAQLIASGLLVQISGATVTIPSAARLFARVEQAQNSYQEARRQKQSFRVSCWCPAPLLRDQIASTIDTTMASTSFLALADGTSARITLAGGATVDQSENASLYRRDLVYAADYATNGDNYTRMTNYIAATLSAGMGLYVGEVINSTLFQNIRATLLAFLQAMLSQGLLGSTTGSQPFSVICDITNNPQTRTALGYVQADVQVQYQGINEKFIVNVEGGQTVQISSTTVSNAPS